LKLLKIVTTRIVHIFGITLAKTAKFEHSPGKGAINSLMQNTPNSADSVPQTLRRACFPAEIKISPDSRP
jgi:hypothetical protein